MLVGVVRLDIIQFHLLPPSPGPAISLVNSAFDYDIYFMLVQGIRLGS